MGQALSYSGTRVKAGSEVGVCQEAGFDHTDQPRAQGTPLGVHTYMREQVAHTDLAAQVMNMLIHEYTGSARASVFGKVCPMACAGNAQPSAPREPPQVCVPEDGNHVRIGDRTHTMDLCVTSGMVADRVEENVKEQDCRDMRDFS